MQHFEHVSYVRGGVHVELNLGLYAERLEKAQRRLGEMILLDCKACMPHRTGSLQQRSYVTDGGRRVVFPGPYARYLYMGLVMVDRETGKGPRKIPTGPGEYILRFRKGAKLKPTNRRLTYSNPEAVDHWFDEAKARNLPAWISKVRRIILTGEE